MYSLKTEPSGGAAASSRPPFQRPVNPNSTLIANGWMEQQRRSKTRTVWKGVLVSLVARRRLGEETTRVNLDAMLRDLLFGVLGGSLASRQIYVRL